MPNAIVDVWASGDAYERYVGRWSRPVAREFLAWVDAPPAHRWLDVGCGTGALSAAVVESCAPASVWGVDRASPYVTFAARRVGSPRATFAVADAQTLPLPPAAVDVVVSGLVLNFIPRPEIAVREMKRVLRAGGVAAVYVWDYAGEMQFMRRFWDAANALDASAVALDEGRRFPICAPAALESLFGACGFEAVTVRSIDVATRFTDFDDYWTPFLGGQGPAPSYVAALGEADRVALRERIRASLPIERDGSIALTARAWAVKGTNGTNGAESDEGGRAC